MSEAIEKALAKFKAALDAARNSKKTPEQIAKAKELYDSMDPCDRSLLEYIFPEVVESEDEKIRKELIQFLTDIKGISESGRTVWSVRSEDAEMCSGFIAYLEKQKEQKQVGLNIPSAGSGAWGTTPPAYKLDVKPAEWSEEEKADLDLICAYLNGRAWISYDKKDKLVDFLKSLRPQSHWKPSEEQNVRIPGYAIENIELAIDLLEKKKFGCMANALRETLVYVKGKNWKCDKKTLAVFKNCLPELESSLNASDYARIAILYNDLKKLM